MRKKAKVIMALCLSASMFLASTPVMAQPAGEQNQSEISLYGGSFNYPTYISLDRTYSDNLSVNEDADYYKFTIGSSGRVRIKSSAYMEYVTYRIYDEDGNEVYQSWRNKWNSTTEKIAFDGYADLTKGSYYFVAEKCDGCTGNYNFKLSFASAGESFTETGYGTNNSLDAANKVSLNKTYKGQIADNDEKDFYKFTLPSSGRISLKSSAYIEYLTYRIYDIDGNEIYQSWRNEWNSTTEKITFDGYVDLTKGSYYFVVEKCDGCTGNYNFKLSFASAGESFTETGYGTNNTLQTANKISLNQIYRGQIAGNDEKDFYKFTMNSSGRIYLKSQARPRYLYYKVYDYTGACIWDEGFGWGSAWHEASQKNIVNEPLDLKKGTYYLAVERKDSNTGNYTLGLYRYTSIKSAKVSLSKSSYTYNGKSQKPGVTVKRGSTVLKKGKDYKVSYKSNKNVGTAKVVIKGIGKYNGTITKTFTIKPAGTSLKKVSGGSRKISVSLKMRTTQTSGYQVQFAGNSKFTGASTITLYSNRYTSCGRYNLKAKKRYYVRVRTYKIVDGKWYYSNWSAAKSAVTKG